MKKKLNYFYEINFFFKKGSGKIFLKNLINKISYNYIKMLLNILKFKIIFYSNFFNYYDIYVIIKPNIYIIIGLSFGFEFLIKFLLNFFKKKFLKKFFFFGIINYNYNIIPINNIYKKIFLKKMQNSIFIISKKNYIFLEKYKHIMLIKINNLSEIKYLIRYLAQR